MELVKKRIPTAKELLVWEMRKHLDSHTHLCAVNTNASMRPILIDAVLVEDNDYILDLEMMGTVAAQADEKSILIIDSNTFNDVDIVGARIIYIVGSGPTGSTIFNPDSPYPRHAICVSSVEAALVDIHEKMGQVTALADLDDPTKLPKALWSYMAIREVRIIGNFRMLAKCMPFADMIVQHRPDHYVQQTFATKSIGSRVFQKNNLALVLEAYRTSTELAEKLHVDGCSTASPYMHLVLENLKDKRPNTKLVTALVSHYKDKHGKYHCGENFPDDNTDLLIIDYEQWKTWAPQNAFVFLVGNEDTPLLVDVVNNPKVLAVKKSRYDAIKFILAILRINTSNPDAEEHMGLSGIRNVHIFNNVISDAYSNKE